MTITIELDTELAVWLQEKATQEGREAEAVAAAVLAEARRWEAQDHAEAVEGIRRGLADFDAGRYKTLEEVIAEKQAKYDLPG
jgi:predicted transcriptional regulator